MDEENIDLPAILEVSSERSFLSAATKGERATRGKFKMGDHVRWNSEADRVSGTIRKKITAPIEFTGYTAHASTEEPQYVIESDKTPHLGMHKGSALRKMRRPALRDQGENANSYALSLAPHTALFGRPASGTG